MERHHIDFSLLDEDSVKALAIFLSELVRQGVTYDIMQCGMNVTVALTGGF